MMIDSTPQFGVALVVHTGCNRNCGHCIRESVFGSPYCLAYEEVVDILRELRGGLGHEKTNIYFTGGGVTTWRSGDAGIEDILIRCSEEGFSPVLATNGDAFGDPEFLAAFVDDYTRRGKEPSYVWVTADKWHGNMDLRAQTIPCVDKIRRALSGKAKASTMIVLRIQSTVGAGWLSPSQPANPHLRSTKLHLRSTPLRVHLRLKRHRREFADYYERFAPTFSERVRSIEKSRVVGAVTGFENHQIDMPTVLHYLREFRSIENASISASDMWAPQSG